MTAGEMMDPRLYEKEEDCCGCGACMSICPNQAIFMSPDRNGFLYPEIRRALCTQCGACEGACACRHPVQGYTPRQAYAAATTSSEILQSASGGAFAGLAKEILRDNGVVFGCAMDMRGGALAPGHTAIHAESELYRLQGSKYVQSDVGSTYRQAKACLLAGKAVLYTGTPCQIAGLRAFLKADHPNLYTIDIICHGVPSAQLFRDYIAHAEKRRGKITSFCFRDKKNGWGLTAKAEFLKKGSLKQKWLPSGASSYYWFFLHGDIYRESCYACRYASPQRVGDITIGDYWGIRKAHPEWMAEKSPVFREEKGVSCVLVNTRQGERLLERYGANLEMKRSSFENIARENGQLNSPSRRSNRRDTVFQKYAAGGYQKVEAYFRSLSGLNYYAALLKGKIPPSIRRKLKALRGQSRKVIS